MIGGRHVAGWAGPPGTAQRGSVSVLAAGVLVLAALLTLASVDVMRAVGTLARAQAAADAAALAAAQEIAAPTGGWSPTDAAAFYARRNGAALVSCGCTFGSSEAVVQVEANLALLFVGPDRTVRAEARAVIGVAGSDTTGRMARDVRYGMGSRGPASPG
jgi:secretion/DNA translocation related TadE-like protein